MRPIMDKISFLKKEIDKISKCIFVIALSLFFDWSLSAQTFNVSYQNAPLSEILLDISKQYNIPIRNQFDCDILRPDILYMDFTIKNVSENALQKMIYKYIDKFINIYVINMVY